jgi:hypothetical protein
MSNHKKGQQRDDSEKEAEEFWRNFVTAHPADLFIFDPMRSMHSYDENDSAIEGLLVTLRRTFGNAAVVVAHHMRKRSGEHQKPLSQSDPRVWSDDARGSSAIKAHADVIVCQEQVREEPEGEILHFAAFMKDGPDVDPIRLDETDHNSFFWEVSPEIPTHLRSAVQVLNDAGGRFPSYAAAAKALQEAHVAKATSYRKLEELKKRGWLAAVEGDWVLRTTPVRMSIRPSTFQRGKEGPS